MKKRRIVMSVINDLATDQRVRKVCSTLHYEGFDILLIGRRLKNSLPVDDRPYKVKRMRMFFERGPLFYSFYNIRLFFFLLFTRCDILHSNDLDTLLPNYLISRLRKKLLVYDSHELFCEVPELVSRPRVQKIWKFIERSIFPKLKYVITVNDSIAEIYFNKYKVPVRVLRNLPVANTDFEKGRASDFGLDDGRKIVILQGTGINIDRGAEELLQAMTLLEGAVLVIAGSGDVLTKLKRTADTEPALKGKVIFFDKMPYDRLMQLTSCAHCGVTLDKDTNLNYRYSLPNKVFDYMRAGIPVLSSDLPELKRIVEFWDIGLIVKPYSVEAIATKLKEILFEIPAERWQASLTKAAHELNWEKEKHKLTDVYDEIKN